MEYTSESISVVISVQTYANMLFSLIKTEMAEL